MGVSGVGGAIELEAPVEDGERCMVNMFRGVHVGLEMRPELEAEDVLRINRAVSAILPKSTAVLGIPDPGVPARAALIARGVGRLLRRVAMSMQGGDLRCMPAGS